MFYADLMLNKYVFVLVVVCLIFFDERKILKLIFFQDFFYQWKLQKNSIYNIYNIINLILLLNKLVFI